PWAAWGRAWSARPPPARRNEGLVSARHDVLLHRREDREQLLLFARRHPELPERLAEVADQGFEVAAARAHAGMRLLQAPSGLDAWLAGGPLSGGGQATEASGASARRVPSW